MSSTVVLQANDIVKELGQGAGKVRALKGVNLTLEAGQLTLLMGPSGSGKTTLLRCLNVLETSDDGAIQVDGVEVGLFACILLGAFAELIALVEQFDADPTCTWMEEGLSPDLHSLPGWSSMVAGQAGPKE